MEKDKKMKNKEIKIYEKINNLRRSQKVKSNKFLGAMTSEVIKEFLKKEGLNVSKRDCFIQGVSNEIDLMIVKQNAQSIFDSYYKSEDILCVFEIKFRGSYGKESIKHVRRTFENVKKVNPKIICIYLTIYENQNYKYRITKYNVKGEVFELFKLFTSMDSAIKRGIFHSSGDWNRLIKFLRQKILDF